MSNPIKIMVVDDEEGILDFMQKILRLKCGYQTVGALGGQEAIDLYKKEKPDISILDVQLGFSKLTGIDVLREIKKTDPQAKCIMITRITEEDSIQQAKELGAIHYLLKPIETKEWLEVVKEVAQTVGVSGG